MPHDSVRRIFLTGAMLALALGWTPAAMAGAIPESKEPIKIALNEWTGQNVTAKLIGKIYENMGYTVEYVTAGAMPQFTAMAEGTLTLQPEVWTNLVGDAYPKALEAGTITELGLLGLNNYEGWAYPAYMEELCPGLPKLSALTACKDQIATPETFPNGRILAYPADWGTQSQKLIEDMQLPFTAVPAGSEGAEVAEIKAAFLNKQPLVLMFWRPHWIHAQYDLRFVEVDAPHGFPQARVVKAAWSGMDKKWPAAFKLLNSFQFDGADQSKLVFEIDQKGRNLDEVVAEWLKQHESAWKSWTEAAMR